MLSGPAAVTSPSLAAGHWPWPGLCCQTVLCGAELASRRLFCDEECDGSKGLGRYGRGVEAETPETSRDNSPVVNYQSLEKQNLESWEKPPLALGKRQEPSRGRNRSSSRVARGSSPSACQHPAAAMAHSLCTDTDTAPCCWGGEDTHLGSRLFSRKSLLASASVTRACKHRGRQRQPPAPALLLPALTATAG